MLGLITKIRHKWGIGFESQLPWPNNPSRHVLAAVVAASSNVGLDLFSTRISAIIGKRLAAERSSRFLKDSALLRQDIDSYFALHAATSGYKRQYSNGSEIGDESCLVQKKPRLQTPGRGTSTSPKQLPGMRPRSRALQREKDRHVTPDPISTNIISGEGIVPVMRKRKSDLNEQIGHACRDADKLEYYRRTAQLGLEESEKGGKDMLLPTTETHKEIPGSSINGRKEERTDGDLFSIVSQIQTGYSKLSSERAELALWNLENDLLLKDDGVSVCLQLEILALKKTVPEFLVLDSFFFENLPELDSLLQAKRDKKFQLKYADLRPLPLFIAPIHHIEEKHWSLCVIDMNKGTILHYDSIENRKRFERTVARVKKWMLRVQDLKTITATRKVSTQASQWFLLYTNQDLQLSSAQNNMTMSPAAYIQSYLDDKSYDLDRCPYTHPNPRFTNYAKTASAMSEIFEILFLGFMQQMKATFNLRFLRRMMAIPPLAHSLLCPTLLKTTMITLSHLAAL